MGVFYYVENIRARESRHHGDVPKNKYKLVKSYLLTIGRGSRQFYPLRWREGARSVASFGLSYAHVTWPRQIDTHTRTFTHDETDTPTFLLS